MYDLAIIGGGACGLFATALALKRGLSVCLIEASDRVGKKLLSTGNGKCNLSNTDVTCDNYNTDKVSSIIDKYTPGRIVEEFNALGLLTRTVGDRIYPYSEQASGVLNALRSNIENARLMENSPASRIIILKSGYQVITPSGEVNATNVCVACGSGATMGKVSYNLLKDLGYELAELRPSLLPILVTDNSIKGMQGVRCKVKATIYYSDKTYSEEGEALFKDNALSGIVMFGLSSKLARSGCEECEVSLDFAPDLVISELERILKDIGIDNMFHKSIVTNIKNRAVDIISQARTIKNYRIKCAGNTDGKQAQVMSGGISPKDFDMTCMESIKHKGLYAIGEVVNVDGDCGGYNLHWAWASALAMIDNITK